MPASTHTIKIARTIGAPPAEVYRMFTHATALRDWLCFAAQTEPRLGGRIYLYSSLGYHVTGKYTALVPDKKVALTWQGSDEPAPTKVSITLTPKGDGTALTLSHSGIGSGKRWPQSAKAIKRSWEEELENLQSVLESGIDLRQARTPRLGIWIGEFNPQIAEKLGVPVTYGIRLEGTAPNTGAAAAGLEKDDVLVSLGGKKLGHMTAIQKVLQAHHAGDPVDAIYYRGKEKRRVKIELSARPMPAIVPPRELAERARKEYAALNAELLDLLKGATEHEAEFRITPDAWNVKENIAHLIACERDYQSWLADMVNDNVAGDSLEYRPNAAPRLAAMVHRFQTVPALLKELECAENETLDFLGALPSEFVARKHLYARAAFWMTDVVADHFRAEHFPSIKQALEGARARAGDGTETAPAIG